MSRDAVPMPAWDAAHLLAEPTRRQVFEAVRGARRPLTRDEVAQASGINRRLATFHLDLLATAGLLDTDYARPEGRVGGPGAGRPAKRYCAAAVQIELSMPPRHYDLAARLLARAIHEDPADAAGRSLTVARSEGRRIGELRRPVAAERAEPRVVVIEALADLGYEPDVTGTPTMRLRNCPFRMVAEAAPDLVCGMNHELICGLVEGLGIPPARVDLDGRPPDCCVTVTVSDAWDGGQPRSTR
jgi:predicted ArsR family transcriptional regulator